MIGRNSCAAAATLLTALACTDSTSPPKAGQVAIPDVQHTLAIPSTTPQISMGSFHSCGLKDDGTVVCWGLNSEGQTTVPTDLGPVARITAGSRHTCALKTDGTVKCWGSNGNGAVTVPANIAPVAQLTAYEHTCALKRDGTVVCWGYNANGQATVPPGLPSIAQLSAGVEHTCAVTTTGTVVCWGYNVFGQATPPPGLDSVIQVSLGSFSSCALKTNGTVICWGRNIAGQATPPPTLAFVTQITAGGSLACALKTDRSVVCWGHNSDGQQNVPSELATVTAQVSVGALHICAYKLDGTVVCWGHNIFGQATPPPGLILSQPCTVPGLNSITDPEAISFELLAPLTPPSSLAFPSIQYFLDQQTGHLLGMRVPNLGVQRTSGYRPPAYQQHLRDLRTQTIQYNEAVLRVPSQSAACLALKQALDFEIEQKHGLTRDAVGVPRVSLPVTSSHTVFPAAALDLSTLNLTSSQRYSFDSAASLAGLTRPCPSDVAHFTLFGTPCKQSVVARAESPVALLLTDPTGRRVGFDPVGQAVINEIGADAFYSGVGSEPQYIEVGEGIPGTYILNAYGIGTGPYRLYLDRIDEHLNSIESQSTVGTVTPGQLISLQTGIPMTVDADIKPGGFPNTIQPGSNGNIPVAVLSTGLFDAVTSVHPTSLRFGRTGSEASLRGKCGSTDINGDGRRDLLCHFDTRTAGFDRFDTQGILTGRTTTGDRIQGIDWIQIVGASK